LSGVYKAYAAAGTTASRFETLTEIPCIYCYDTSTHPNISTHVLGTNLTFEFPGVPTITALI